MTRRIKKVAIVGSGIMGSGIACHFDNIGVEVLLLDIIPRELNEKEKAKGLSLKIHLRKEVEKDRKEHRKEARDDKKMIKQLE